MEKEKKSALEESMFGNCLYFASNALARHLTRLADEVFAVTGLSPSLAFVLLAAAEHPGLPQKEVASHMQLQASTITRFIDKLEQKGLLRRVSEGKTTHIEPTPKGLALVPKIRASWLELYWRYAALLGEEQTEELVERVNRATQKFEG